MNSLVDALYDAIPEAEKERLSCLPAGAMENGGTSRGWERRIAAVCTYNNTIPNQQGIIDWYERAIMGVRMRGGEPDEVSPEAAMAQPSS